MKFTSTHALAVQLSAYLACALPVENHGLPGSDSIVLSRGIDSLGNHEALSKDAIEATLDSFHAPEPWEISKRQEERVALVDPAVHV
jgi:hypothetical protein